MVWLLSMLCVKKILPFSPSACLLGTLFCAMFFLYHWVGSTVHLNVQVLMRLLPSSQLVAELLLRDSAASSTRVLVCSLCCSHPGLCEVLAWFTLLAVILFLWCFWTLCMRAPGLVTMAAVFWIQQQDVKGAGCWELAQVHLEVRSYCFYGFVAGLERYRVSLIIQNYSQLFKIQI